MKLRTKVILFIVSLLIAIPFIQGNIKIDLNRDGDPDIIIQYKDNQWKIKKSLFDFKKRDL